MTAEHVKRLVYDRGTVAMLIKYPEHYRQIITIALSDDRPGHGARERGRVV